MMRYQRVSPDCLPLASGKKPNSRSCKEEEAESGRISNYGELEGKALRVRRGTSPFTSQDQNFQAQFVVSYSLQSESHATKTTQESSPSGDVLLQWGHNKRSRRSRAENRVVTDESSAQARQVIKIHRKVAHDLEKQTANQTIFMPPPVGNASCSRSTNLRYSTPIHETSGSLNRNLEGRSGPGNRPSSSNGTGRTHPRSTPEKRSPPSPEKTDKTTYCTATPTSEKTSRSAAKAESMNIESLPQSELETGSAPEKLNLDLFEWPRIYLSLSRKEKEDDFLVMKGTKLPQRPKKRAKNLDKTLQYCFPGMWLSDLTRGRYEVREKKCTKKLLQKRRGLKGMESMDSESE